ncbi:DinB family protein [Nonomuraea sp. SYSU D8015]|uniref:DinB family protein n=1 Tax=Nonomuraea sp. SYSU D8015 TaxID=2593644 RepID=UPI001660E329|nr:DinB family protein [Nonomuraea sp. SYSU D8015]
MASVITDTQWTFVRTALERTGDRFSAMVSSAPALDVKATKDWSIAETAAHVTAITWLYTYVIRSDRDPFPFPDLNDHMKSATLDTVAEFNVITLRHFTERDTRVLAERLRAEIGQLLRMTENLDPARQIAWLGDSRIPLAGLFAHLLNELQIHGHDISRAIGTRWEIPPREAAQFFELFFMGVAHNDVGRLLDTGVPPLDRRIAIAFHSPYTTDATLVLRKGRISAEEPGGDVDVRVSFDPATLNLMLFHRISRLRALLSGKVVVTGRRPWLLLPFLRLVNMP